MSSISSSAPSERATRGRPIPVVPTRLPAPLFRFDPGWLFLIVGIVTVAATVVIPAQHDLENTRWQRDKALAVERQRQERVSNYGEYLAALKKQDESVVLSLATVQLTKSPENRVPLLDAPDPARTSASVFPSLEPSPVREPPPPTAGRRASTLDLWTTNPSTRLWLLAGGVLCILIGLLPAAKAAPASTQAA